MVADLDQTPLHVSRLCSFDSCVHQTFSTSHCMEEELCWRQARIEAVLHKTLGCWNFRWKIIISI